MRWRFVLSLSLCLAAAARPTAAETVRIFAASSLTEPFQEIAAAFERRHPDTRVALHFAGTQLLRTQIEQGAPADVMAAADLIHADALVQQGLLQPYRVFARNELVMIVPSGSVLGLPDLARPGVKLVIAAATVPAGRYAREALQRLAASGVYGPGYMGRALANVVSEETNVRAVLAKVSLGEADAGFVYATDVASGRRRVTVLPLPDAARVEASYAIGVVKRGRPAADAFVAAVLAPEGQVVLRRRGFRP